MSNNIFKDSVILHPRLPRILLLALPCLAAAAQSIPTSPTQTIRNGEELKYVVLLSRHGVRSPTGKATQYSQYSAAKWPAWSVVPGYLTPHGFHLMELFGAYDRAQLASEGLLHSQGCEDAASVTFYADSDQRTRETGKALAQGLLPGCSLSVDSLPEGTNDPLFHPLPPALSGAATSRAASAIAGRIGGDPANLTVAYKTQLAVLDNLLATCGASNSPQLQKRISLFEIPATLSPGTGDHLVDLKGPLNTAATLSENLLLEYAEGMETANVGWGCIDGPKLRSLIDLHTAATDFTQHTPAIATAQAANLLRQIQSSLAQSIIRKQLPGALGRPQDRALFLIGHDTNLENIAGALHLDWIADGRRNDTPPGSALVFELWRNSSTSEYRVRLYYTAQTLEQMRTSAVLTLAEPAERVPVFLPDCSQQDFSCTWSAFSSSLGEALGSQP